VLGHAGIDRPFAAPLALFIATVRSEVLTGRP